MWYNKYIGIPYKDNGRDTNGFDCWGLVRYIYKEQYDIDLPSFELEYVGASDRDTTTELLATKREKWNKVEFPKEGDVVLFRILGLESHVGIYLGNSKFIHAKERHNVVIESLDSISWRSRVAGYYRYDNSNSAILTAAPHPFKTQKYIETIKEGTSIEQIVKNINDKYKISDKLSSKIAVLLNGKLVEKEIWHKVFIKSTDVLEYRAVPQGSNPLRSILMIVVMVAATLITGGAASAFLNSAFGTTGMFAAGSISAAVAGSIVAIAGMALVDAIAPIRLPSQNQNNPGSPVSQNLFTGGSNPNTPYGAIPVILGKVRITPPLAGQPLIAAEPNTSFLKMPVCWGFGPIDLDTSSLLVGTVPLVDYTAMDGKQPEYASIDLGPSATTQTEKNQYTAIYSTDTKQVYPNIELTATAAAPGPWFEVSLENFDNPINSAEIVLSFPEGLRRIITSGSEAGQSRTEYVEFQYQIAKSTETFPDVSNTLGRYTLRAASSVTLPIAIYYLPTNPYDTQYGYRWLRIGLNGDMIVTMAGSVTDSKFSDPSSELQTILNATAFNSSSSRSTGPIPFARLPEWAPNIVPLYDVCVTGMDGVINPATDVIDHRSGSYNGLGYTISPPEPDYTFVY